MSFLSSILSTIGDPSAAPSASSGPRSTTSQSKPPVPKVPAANGVTTPQATKRKAEGDTGSAPAKIQKKDDPPKPSERANGSIRPAVTPAVTKIQASASTDPLPYRGTARAGSAPAPATKQVPKPLVSVSKPAAGSGRSVSKPTTPTTTAPPKKGSYQEILARAKAQQAQQSQVGVIKHKKVDNTTRKERVAQQQDQKPKAGPGKEAGKNRAGGESKIKVGETLKEKKKAADLGYHGTMRPAAAEPSYKGTMKPGASSKGRTPGSAPERSGYKGTAAAGRGRDRGRASGYDSYSDEEEDEYESDQSSDMEAAAFEVEEEDMVTLRTAKKEDAEAQREEDELKRKKELRKKMLSKMAAENAKKRRF